MDFVSEDDLVSSIKHVLISAIDQGSTNLQVHTGYPVRHPIATKMRSKRISEEFVLARDRLGRKHRLRNPSDWKADLVIRRGTRRLLVMEAKIGGSARINRDALAQSYRYAYCLNTDYFGVCDKEDAMVFRNPKDKKLWLSMKERDWIPSETHVRKLLLGCVEGADGFDPLSSQDWQKLLRVIQRRKARIVKSIPLHLYKLLNVST